MHREIEAHALAAKQIIVFMCLGRGRNKWIVASSDHILTSAIFAVGHPLRLVGQAWFPGRYCSQNATCQAEISVITFFFVTSEFLHINARYLIRFAKTLATGPTNPLSFSRSTFTPRTTPDACLISGFHRLGVHSSTPRCRQSASSLWSGRFSAITCHAI